MCVFFFHEHIPAALDHNVVAGSSVVAEGNSVAVEVRGKNIVAEDTEAAEAVADRIEAVGRVAVVMRPVREVVENIAEGCMGWFAELKDMEAATGQGMEVAVGQDMRAAQPARISRTCS